MRRLGICALILTVCVTAVQTGISVAGPASPGPASAAAKKKPKKCKKGYKRKRVKGKVRCVKVKKKTPAPAKTPAAPTPAPNTTPAAPARITDPAKIKQQIAGSLWFWTHFDQAGTGGTTDRSHVNLCADGRFRLRRSSTTTDGQGGSFTVIIEDLAPTWDVLSGYVEPATGDIEARVQVVSTQRRTRTANGPEFSAPNETLTTTLARKAGVVTMDGEPAFLVDEPPLCDFE